MLYYLTHPVEYEQMCFVENYFFFLRHKNRITYYIGNSYVLISFVALYYLWYLGNQNRFIYRVFIKIKLRRVPNSLLPIPVIHFQRQSLSVGVLYPKFSTVYFFQNA